MFPRPIQKFIDAFSALPSIGPRQATRLAFHILKLGKASIQELTDAVASLGTIQTCSRCFVPYEANLAASEITLCWICSNKERNQSIIAIVEKPTDLIALEKTKKYKGRYLVLGELDRDGILDTEQKLRIANVKRTIEKEFGMAEEILIALNPTTLGDIDSALIMQ